MLQITETMSFLIWAAIIGICYAVVYTNVQRGAISKFINALIESGCFDEQSAKTLDGLEISGISAKIVKKSVSSQHGLRRIIGVIIGKPIEKDETNVFSTKIKTDNLYYLNTTDTEEILKKYSFRQMSAKYLVLFIASLLLLGYLTSIFAGWMYRYITIPELEETPKTEQGKPVDNTDIIDENLPDTETEDVSDDTANDSEDDDMEANENPQIPSSPSIPTLPTN